MRFHVFAIALICLAAAGCSRLADVGSAPGFTQIDDTVEARAMLSPGLPSDLDVQRRADSASLWSGSRGSLLGDRRATRRGDIMTVVIEIDDEAEISNSSSRGRSGDENLSINQLVGIPQRINPQLPEGASLSTAADISSSSSSSGDGSVRRNEKLELRVAATVIDEFPNGVLRIQGSQEVRVNFELRELLITGYVRPEDISRQNEVTYDKIASARISYGGRGQITDVQQPRYGQQVADILLPF
ncbi:MAG: flagellar basal body L-ring protein FlgH [Rhodobacteraceae bacterium]|nr:flagellar basal body L-ring protein FlgH [Paracoccaceae bacterium]